MQTAVFNEKQSQKEAQSKKKKAARKSTKTSSSLPNGNSLDPDKIVIDSDAEKDGTAEVTLIMASEIEELGTSQSTREVPEEPPVKRTATARLGESDSSPIGREESTQSQLSPALEATNAGEGVEKETLLVATTSGTNVDDNHTDSETEKQETEPAQSGTATRGRDLRRSKKDTEPEIRQNNATRERDLSGNEDQAEPEVALNITTTRGRDLSGSEDQTESDTGTKGGKRKRGRPPKNRTKLASSLSNSDRGNQDKDVRGSVAESDGGEPGASVESIESAEELTSLNVTDKSVVSDNKSPTVSPRGIRKGKKSSDVSSAVAEVMAISPGRKRRKRGAGDADEAKDDAGTETTSDDTATPGDDETKPKVGKSTKTAQFANPPAAKRWYPIHCLLTFFHSTGMVPVDAR